MKAQELTHALERIATEGIPTNVDLWPVLQTQQGAQVTRTMGAPGGQTELRRLRLAFIPLAVLLAAVVTILALGPQRVWADIQRLFGYVPGIGITDLEQARILAAPVQVSRDGVSVRVEQAIAGPQGIQIVLHSEGLPPGYANQGLRGGGGDSDIGVKLRLPDGQMLAPTEWSLRYGGATFQFPALPANVNQATLELDRLPLVPANIAPENWSIAFTVQPATGLLVAERFSEPYHPHNASDTHADVTVRVLEVAHSADATAVRVQVTWDNQQTRIRDAIGRYLPTLRDDRGRVYQRSMASNVGAVAGQVVQPLPAGVTPAPTRDGGAVETTLTFAPIAGDARRLTLEVDGVDVDIPAAGQFKIDLGERPAIGDHWPLDVNLQVAGFPVHLTGARLVEEELHLRNGVLKRTNLEFDVDPVADQDGRALRGFRFETDLWAFNGGGGGYNYDTDRIRVNVSLREGAAIPPGPLTFNLVEASIVQAGPWQVTWDVPEGAVVTR